MRTWHSLGWAWRLTGWWSGGTATATPAQFCMHSLNDIYETYMEVRQSQVGTRKTIGCVDEGIAQFEIARLEDEAGPGWNRPPAPPEGAPPWVVLTFGGSDPAGLTAPVAEALLPSLPPDTELHVVVGPDAAAATRARLEALPDAGRLRILADVGNMAEVLSGAALAVAAAGSTTWELLALGVPALLVTVADNQRVVQEGLAGRGVAVDLGWHEEVRPEAVRDAVLRLLADAPERARLAAAGRALIDGRGVWRITDALCDAIEARGSDRA